MASRIVRFMRRQNLPGACCDREHRRQNLASMRMASGFASCRTIPESNERRYGACSTRCRIHWRHDHARRYALGKLVCLAVGASRAGHRHPYLGLDPAATARASAEAALTPHFRPSRAAPHPTEPRTGLGPQQVLIHHPQAVHDRKPPRLPAHIYVVVSDGIRICIRCDTSSATRQYQQFKTPLPSDCYYVQRL